MSNELRITGDNPTPELLEKYPNWEYALDEETVPDRDETTLRPAEDQSLIGQYVPFTGGTVCLNDGRECPAIIELIHGVAGIHFHLGGRWYRLLRSVDRFGQFERWEPYVEDWLPEEERFPSVSLSDETFFPLRFASRLPYFATSAPIKARIAPDGTEQPWG